MANSIALWQCICHPLLSVDRGDAGLQYEPMVASIVHELTPYRGGGRHGRLIVD